MATGKFKVNSAWELLREKQEENPQYKHIWVKGLPFKFCFLTWRIWGSKIPVATYISKWDSNVSTNYLCCTIFAPETIQHLFLTGDIARRVWTYFTNAAGFHGPWIQIKQSIQKLRDAPGNVKLKAILDAVSI